MKRRITTRLIRRQVRLVIEDSKSNVTGFSELDYFIASTQSRVQIIFWILLIILAACICCYHIKDRIDWYFTYPLSVEISIEKPDVTDKLELKFCNIYTGRGVQDITVDDNKQQMKFQPAVHEPIVTDVNIFTNNGSKNTIINNVNLRNEISYLGKCSIIDIGKQVADNILVIATKSTQITINDRTEGRMYIDTRNGRPKINWFWKLQFRKYKLYNSPSHPCVSENDFARCFDECIVKLISKTQTCRYYTYPNEIKLPPCPLINTFTFAGVYDSLMDLIFRTDVYENCNCINSCNRLDIAFTGEQFRGLFETSTVDIETSNFVVTMRERIAYDAISLATDFGGSLALFLGLTILSISDVIITTTLSAKTKLSFRKQKSKTLSPIISSVYKNYCDTICGKTGKTQSMTRNFMMFDHVAEIVVWILCSVLTIFMIQDRVQYYLLIPTTFVVELDTIITVKLPSITNCFEHRYIDELKREYSREKHIAHWCSVDMLDLLNISKNITIDKLWEKRGISNINMNIRKYPVFTDLATHVIKDETLTHHGSCYHSKFENETIKANADYLVQLIYDDTACNNYLVYYGDPESDTYNVINEIYPVNTQLTVDYRLQTITRVSTPSRTCTEVRDYARCKDDCLLKQLQTANLCYLPFLPQNSATESCNSIESAKRSRNLAVEILAKVANGRICHCVRACIEEMYLLSVRKSVGAFSYTQVHMMSSNVIERVTEIVKYTLVSLFCDIGNSLGIALGISILTLLKFAHRGIHFKRNSILSIA